MTQETVLTAIAILTGALCLIFTYKLGRNSCKEADHLLKKQVNNFKENTGVTQPLPVLRQSILHHFFLLQKH